DESFSEAWDRFNDLLRACPHHRFFELHQLDTFYNALNVNDHDSLNSDAGGNFLDKIPSDCLKIIESKSKVRQSQAKAVVSKVYSSSSTPAISSDVAELKDLVRALLLDKKNQSSAPAPSPIPAPVKAVSQPPAYQAPAYQAPIPQTQSVSQTDFERYVKANDAVLRNIKSQGQSKQNQCQNIQNQYQNVQNQLANLADMMSKFMSSNTASSSGSGTLPGNTITNPKENLKGITTRSGVAYQGPTIPTPSKVMKQRIEVTKDQVQTPSSQSTVPVQPRVAQSKTLVSEPVVAPVRAPMPNLKPSIPYPSRRDNERCRDQANEQIEKFYEIFKDMSFEISFTDALILMPNFASTLKALIGNKDKLRMDECLALADLGASINLMPLFVWEGLPLSEPTLTCMTLELADRSVFKPIGNAKDVSVKVGVFQFPPDFVVVDFEPDPRVPLILGRYSANYDQMTANKIDVTNEACEEYTQEVLGFSDVTASGSPIPSDDPIVSTTSPTLTPFGDSDFLLFEEVDAFLGLEDDPNSSKFDPSYYDPEGDILLLEAILNSEPSPPLPSHEQNTPSPWVNPVHCVPTKCGFTVVENEENELIPTRLVIGWRGTNTIVSLMVSLGIFKFPLTRVIRRRQHSSVHTGHSPTVTCLSVYAMHRARFKRCMLALFHDMVEKTMEVFMDDFSVFGNSFENCLSCLDKMLQRCEDTKLYLNWEKSHFMVKEGLVLGHKISKNGIEVDKAKVDVITKLPHPTTVKGVWSFLGHAGFYRRFIKDFSKISRPMTHLLEKDTSFIFSEDCIKAFQTLKKKLTEAPILIASNWDLPFELMCDASDFAISAVLGQRHEKHFRPIHYASKTLTDAECNYIMTKKEMLAVVYAFEKFRSYLIMNKSIVHTDHSALKYLFAKKDAKARLLRWVLLL
nr:reverse transcriptase domain-containing protein [Tanacetum cinerariifolium]